MAIRSARVLSDGTILSAGMTADGEPYEILRESANLSAALA